MNGTITYIKSFFRDKDVASVTPTSRWCMRHVCKPIDFERDSTIVEYGAGAGVYAGYLLPRMSTDSHLIMFETNTLLFKELDKIDDARVQSYKKSVAHVDEIIDSSLIGQVDYIISGIPFSFLDEASRMEILLKSKKILHPGGQFLAYQTSGHLEQPLSDTFGADHVYTEWEWRNIPPMTIYRAMKERDIE